MTPSITGVSGQDGTYVAEALLDSGAAVHGTFRPGAAIPKALADQSGGKAIRLVQESSAEILGDTLDVRSETTILAPSSPYGVS